VLSVRREELRETAKALEEAGVNEIHFDFMDGRFVGSITGGAELLEEYVKHVRIPTSVHLMAVNPEKLIAQFEKAGAKEIIVHYEAFNNTKTLEECLNKISASVKKGVAINPNTPVGAVARLAGKIDSLIVMSVFPGKGGQEFMESALDKIREAKALGFKNIIVDGGVTDAQAKKLRDAGAHTLVSGSYLIKNLHAGTVKKLKSNT
jgi:ribulose-phosphate 3-epimerase